MPKNTKHDIEPWREEIEQRTRDGESLEQIAAGLSAKGFETSSKTIGRYRIQWGLRQRAAGRCAGKKYPNRKRKLPDSGPSKIVGQDQRKQEITARTQRGETAEQIADALTAQGFELKKGPSTVWRLQTYWGLIPYDAARARGKHSKNKLAAQSKATAAPRRRGPPTPADPTAFYPSNCANGPQSRTIAIAPNVNHGDGRPMNIDPTFDSDPEPLPDMIGNDEYPQSTSEMVPRPHMTDRTQPDSAPTASNHQSTNVDIAAQLMSAELLVDLATSTLAAASKLKDLYLAQHMQRAANGSMTALPPTNDDIANARLKVREAAGVMYDLAT